MFHERIDLYEYAGKKRGGAQGGYLTTYCRTTNPENKKKSRPAILVIPGGGYNMNSFREGEPVALRFLAAGFAVFVLQYTVKTAYPVPLFEAAAAMKYIRENAEKYDADPARICALGFSAGGHLAGMLSTQGAEDFVATGFGEETIPDAVLLGYPVVTTDEKYTHADTAKNISGGDEKLRARLSVETRVTEKSAPVFLFHTWEDTVVPVENAFLLASAYRKRGVPVEMHVFERGHHGLSVADLETADRPESPSVQENFQQWIPLSLNWLKARGFCVR